MDDLHLCQALPSIRNTHAAANKAKRISLTFSDTKKMKRVKCCLKVCTAFAWCFPHLFLRYLIPHFCSIKKTKQETQFQETFRAKSII